MDWNYIPTQSPSFSFSDASVVQPSIKPIQLPKFWPDNIPCFQSIRLLHFFLKFCVNFNLGKIFEILKRERGNCISSTAAALEREGMDNPKVQEILEQQVLTVAKAVEDKLDDEIAALEKLDIDDLEALRERRLQQMKKMVEKRSRWISLGHGDYSEIPNEKEFFSVVKASERVVCHFYRNNWPCKVMDKHLSILAKQHVETRFVKIHAEKSPYLSEKLRIVVLPTLALIKNAKVDDYVVGFDELGGTDGFGTEELEERLAKAQVIVFEGESSLNSSRSKVQNKRSVWRSSNPDSSDSE